VHERRLPFSRTGAKDCAQPDEIADAVLFLASAKASYITGVNITMDGLQSPVVV